MSPFNPKVKYSGFSSRFSDPPRELLTPVKIRVPSIYPPGTHAWVDTIAFWDTGATNCVIREDLAHSLGLATIGKAPTCGVHGLKVVDVFVIDILLMGTVQFAGWRVSAGNTSPDPDDNNAPGIIIGMDIITKGDFCLMHGPTEILFSFIYPTIENPRDFKAMIDARNAEMDHKQLRQQPHSKNRDGRNRGR